MMDAATDTAPETTQPEIAQVEHTLQDYLRDFLRHVAEWSQQVEEITRKEFDPKHWIEEINSWLNILSHHTVLLRQALTEARDTGDWKLVTSEEEANAADPRLLDFAILCGCAAHLAFWEGPLLAGCTTQKSPIQILSDFTKKIAEEQHLQMSKVSKEKSRTRNRKGVRGKRGRKGSTKSGSRG